jgi:hypothetical protein
VLVSALGPIHEVHLLIFNDHETINLKPSSIKEYYEKTLLPVPPKDTIKHSIILIIHMEEEKPQIMASTTFTWIFSAQPMTRGMFDTLDIIQLMPT